MTEVEKMDLKRGYIDQLSGLEARLGSVKKTFDRIRAFCFYPDKEQAIRFIMDEIEDFDDFVKNDAI